MSPVLATWSDPPWQSVCRLRTESPSNERPASWPGHPDRSRPLQQELRRSWDRYPRPSAGPQPLAQLHLWPERQLALPLARLFSGRSGSLLCLWLGCLLGRSGSLLCLWLGCFADRSGSLLCLWLSCLRGRSGRPALPLARLSSWPERQPALPLLGFSALGSWLW